MAQEELAGDIGPQTIAAVSQNGVVFEKLADGAQNLEDEIRRTQRAMDRSRRSTNPGMFGEDGQIIRIEKLPEELTVCGRDGKLRRKWDRSRRYCALQRRLRYLYRKQAELRDKRHRELVNRLIQLGDEFYIEEMNWRALARKAKQAKRKASGRFSSRKRFGKSIANRSPGRFTVLYRQRVESLGGTFTEINTRAARASQYDHTSGVFCKKNLSERYAHLSDGTTVQRDLYSAFLIGHVNSDLTAYNNETLEKDYRHFIFMHDGEMARLGNIDTKLPSSMGVTK